MTDKLFGLTEDDRNALRDVVRWWNRRPQSVQGRPQSGDLDDFGAPDVYIARTPDGGIPALNIEIPAPSIRTGTGTDIYDEPGSAVCTIYALRQAYYGTGPDELHTAGFTRTVCNISPSAIPGNAWITVSRDKFGRWYAIGFDQCTQVEKTVTGVCWHGTVLKQLFRIKQGCRVLASGCETVLDCGAGCKETGANTGTSTSAGDPTDAICGPAGVGGIPGTGGAGGGGSVCQCPSSGWAYETFTVSGVTDGTCTLCDGINGPWCLAQREPPNCSWTGIRFTAAPCGLGYVQATVQAFEDGSATLTFVSSNINNVVTTLAVYYTRLFKTGETTQAGTTCSPFANSFNLLRNSCDCITWPPSITVTPAANAHACAGSNCAACNATTWSVQPLSSPSSVFVDGTCTGCNAVTFPDLVLTGPCTWEVNSIAFITCGLDIALSHAKLIDNGSTGWELTITWDTSGGTDRYFTPYSGWSCSGVNYMTPYVIGGGCLTTSGLVSVQKTS